MSFILDALKKSDKRRQEGSVPRLDTVHEDRLQSRVGSRHRWLLFGLILLLNLAGLSWFLLRPQPVPPVQAPTAMSAPVASPAVPPATTKPVAEPPASVAQPKQASAQLEAAIAVPLPAPAAPQATSRQALAISELPLRVQRRLPEMHMSLHAYNQADPAAGLVRVNNQLLRPGSKLDGKFLLEEISADGAIFRSDGYRFLLPRN